MEEQALGWIAVEHGHVQCAEDQLGVDRIAQGPADDFAAMKVENTCEKEPAFPGWDVGEGVQWGRSRTIDKWAWWQTLEGWRDRSASMSLTIGTMS